MKPRRWRRWWWIAGAVLAVVAVASRTLAGGGNLSGPLAALVLVWVAVTLFLGLRWLWRKLTYRVGVRLLMSYLLVGVAPFVVLFALTVTALYMVLGQYTSVRWGHEQESIQLELEAVARSAVHMARVHGFDAALEDLAHAAQHPPAPLPNVTWLARDGDLVRRSAGAEDLPVPSWVGDDGWSGVVEHDNLFFEMAAQRAGPIMVAALVPLDVATARTLNQRQWFDVDFVPAGGTEGKPGGYSIDEEIGTTPQVSAGGRRVPVEKVFKPWPEAEGGGLLSKPLVLWIRVTATITDLGSGEPRQHSGLITVLRTSPRRVWQDFVLSRYELGSTLRTVLLALLGIFLAVYFGAALAAGMMTFAIARSTARLSRGAREVARGNLDHRIAVRRHDQLGDLAVSFNAMTEAVQGMLAAVREKERLSHELELARAIQESLLPARELRHGELEVHAAFRPAAEVGGDYFDLFPEEDGRLLVTIGDVAGHGLATGLLMATVKSAVAAMVHEGYRGAEMVRRVNRLLLDQAQRSTMVTLAVVEVDVPRRRLRITNAGHPPALVVAPGGEVEELLVPSLPVGSRLSDPSEGEVELIPGSRVLLYSDGLVEALDDDGEPFGYDALRAAVEHRSNQRGRELVTGLLDDLDRHVTGRPLADDLTILVVETAPVTAGEPSPPIGEDA